MVMPDHRLQLRPCPVMQYGEALADDADKLLERLITPGDDFGARVLGHMDRQRAVRGEHAEMPRLNQHLRRALYDGGDFTRGEAHIRRLGDAEPFAAAIVGDAEPRRIRLRTLNAPQQLEEILPIGQPADFGPPTLSPWDSGAGACSNDSAVSRISDISAIVERPQSAWVSPSSNSFMLNVWFRSPYWLSAWCNILPNR